jgi:hypothetical protein
MPPRRTHVDYFNDCRQVPESLWVEEMTQDKKSKLHLYDERDYLQSYLDTHALMDNSAIPHWILRNDVVEVVYTHPTLRIRRPKKNNVELGVFKSPEIHQLRFIVPSPAPTPTQFDLPSFNDDLEWFKVGLQWLKTYIRAPITQIHFPHDTLYISQDTPAFKLNDAAPPGKKTEQTKRMKDWVADISTMFAKSTATKRPRKASVSAVPLSKKAVAAAAAATLNLKLTTTDGKKTLFDGQPVLASVTSQADGFLLETQTTVKKDQLSLSVTPINETLHKLLTDHRETIHHIYIVPSLSYIIFQFTKSPSKIFKYEKSGKKINYISMDKTIKHKK